MNINIDMRHQSLDMTLVILSFLVISLLVCPTGFAASKGGDQGTRERLDFLKNAPPASAYPEDDSLIINYSLEIKLLPDGKIVRRVHKQEKLFTPYAVDHHCDPIISFNQKEQQLKIIRARSFMKNGKIVDTTANGFNLSTPFALEKSPRFTDMTEMVVSHLGVEKGGIIELDYRLEDKKKLNPFLGGRLPLNLHAPVLAGKISISIPRSKKLYFACQNCTLKPLLKEDQEWRTYSWDLKGRKAAKHHSAERKDWDTISYLLFSTAENWPEALSDFIPLFESAAQKAPAIEKVMPKLSKDAPTAYMKVMALQNKVAKEITSTTWQWPRPYLWFVSRADTVYASKYGTPEEKAALLNGLLNQAGIKSRPVLVSDTTQLNDNIFFPGQFSMIRLLVQLPGEREILLNPACPIQDDQWYLCGGKKALLREKGDISIITLPAKTTLTNLSTVTGKLQIKADLSTKGQMEIISTGFFNPYHQLRNQGISQKTVDKLGNKILGGAKVTGYSFKYFDPTQVKLKLQLAKGAVDKISRGFYKVQLPIHPWSIEQLGIDYSHNQIDLPLEIKVPAREIFQMKISLPENFKVAYLPPKVEKENDSIAFKSGWRQEKNEVIMEREIFIKKVRVQPGRDYREFRQIFLEYFKDKNQTLLLEVR